jgi:type IV pilus assembly protein PilW
MKLPVKQSGMSLVELMVAVTLSLILMAGVLQVYVSAKASYSVQHELSTLQQNQRIAIELLSNDIRKAGLSVTKAVTVFDEANVKEGGGNNSDEITIKYESDKNCLGFNTPDIGEPDAGIAVNRYFVRDNQLFCQGNGVTRGLVQGVVNMQILYGEDTDTIVPGEIRTANRYVQPPNEVNVDPETGESTATTANMNNVVSVRIALLFETDDVVRGVDEADAEERKYFLLDAPAISSSDPQKRMEVVTTTIALRNTN